MGQQLVNPVCHGRLLLLVEQALSHYLLNIIVLLVDNILFIRIIHDAVEINRVIFTNLLIAFQHLDGMPPQIVHVPVLVSESRLHLGDPGLQLRGVADHNPLGAFLVVVNHRVHQHIQAAASSG